MMIVGKKEITVQIKNNNYWSCTTDTKQNY